MADTQSRSSNNIFALDMLFNTPSNYEIFLCQSALYEWSRVRPLHVTRNFLAQHANRTAPQQDGKCRPYPKSSTDGQLSAKMHCLFGPTWPPGGAHGKFVDQEIRPYARTRVYDLRQYRQANLWGPFLDDGSVKVDWEKMETIQCLLANYRLTSLGRDPSLAIADTSHPAGGRRELAFSDAAPDSFIPSISDSVKSSHDGQDPYNITGTWLRVVCYIRYDEFYSFNNPIGRHAEVCEDCPRHPLSAEEICLPIKMKLHVTKIEPAETQSICSLPTVHFEGTAYLIGDQRIPGSDSIIQGKVSPTSDGEVRWTSVSILNGGERWKSEGVQIGGPNSARGVIGTWFDEEYNEHGPVGPTAFWKEKDTIDDDDDEEEDEDD
ncbi:MAG: hypothetical protein Q9225_004927 [Loekoesia sp. 1 TL-2023]